MEAATGSMPRVLSLTESAARLRMKPSNVAKYLARHGVQPYIVKAQGYFWREEDIEAMVAQRDATEPDTERKRRAARDGGQPRPQGTPRVRLGPHQRDLMLTMLRRPQTVTDNATRLALRRLRMRGLVEQTEPQVFTLTDAGREAVVDL